jgi:hypothetical protein
MQTRPWQVATLAALALPALWLLLAGPERVLGIDSGHAGMVLLVTAAWTSLLALSWLPRGAGERAIAPAEWKAWIGTGFMLLAMAFLATRSELFLGVAADRHSAQAGARSLVMLLVAWAVLSQVLAARWKGAVEEDERDREIALRAAAHGRSALVAAGIALAVLLGFSPDDRLAWATHFSIANLLVFGLMLGWLVEYAATALMYLSDRRPS